MAPQKKEANAKSFCLRPPNHRESTPKRATKGSIGPFYLRYELNGKRVWESLTTRTYTFALADARSKESSLLREEATPAKPSPVAPKSLEELRSAFLASKRKERKKDRTPLHADTIRAYDSLTRDFIDLTKCRFPGDISGEKVNDWMLLLEEGYNGGDGKIHKPGGPRTVYNLYTNLSCFLRFCGIEPNPNYKHSYGLRKLVGTNVPGRRDSDPEAFTQEQMDKFFFIITEKRDALAFELFLKTGPRERAGTAMRGRGVLNATAGIVERNCGEGGKRTEEQKRENAQELHVNWV